MVETFGHRISHLVANAAVDELNVVIIVSQTHILFTNDSFSALLLNKSGSRAFENVSKMMWVVELRVAVVSGKCEEGVIGRGNCAREWLTLPQSALW